ncbi:MAG: T9SS C-terminal target domain-containing protein [Cytophagales bacterium]|nr:MAG: T9SS C-terminal target domain-containing protein [Cytophagales bacterium]
MKRFIQICILCILTINLSAPHWEFYRFKQPTYYNYKDKGRSYVELIHQDYISFFTGDLNLYFNFTFKSDDIKCYTQVIAGASDTREYGLMKNVKLGPYKNPNVFSSVRGYTLEIDSNRFDFILPRTGREQWSVKVKNVKKYDSLVIVGFGKYLGDVMPNLRDTIVDYKINFYKQGKKINIEHDSIAFQLSKNFGFKRFIHIPWLFDGKLCSFDIIGLNTKGKTIGFSPPQFKDYFNYLPGTVTLKKWGNQVYIRDSIIQVLKTSDSVVYYSNCQIRYQDDSDIQYFFNRKYVYHKSSLGMLQAPSSWPVLSSYTQFPDGSINNSFKNFFTYYDGAPFELIVDKRDTIIQRSYFDRGIMVDSTYCSQIFVENIQGGYMRYLSFDTKHGFTGYTLGKTEISSNGETVWILDSELKVIGVKKPNSETEGIIEIPPPLSTTNKHDITKSFIIYPNPSTSIINIQSSLQIAKILVYQSNGIKVFESTATENIDVSALPEGLYLLEARDVEGRRVLKKFEKR